MLKNDQTYLKKSGVNTARFLKYVEPFFNIMHKRVKKKTFSNLSKRLTPFLSLTHETPKLPLYRNHSIDLLGKLNQLAGFYMMATLAFNELRNLHVYCIPHVHFRQLY